MQHGPTSVCDVFSVYLWCNGEFCLFILRNDPVLTAHKNPVTVRLVLPKRWRIPSPPHPCSSSISSCLGIFYLGGWWYIEQLLQIHWFRCLLPPPPPSPTHPRLPDALPHFCLVWPPHPPPKKQGQNAEHKSGLGGTQDLCLWFSGFPVLVNVRVLCANDCQGSLADECWGSLCWWMSGFPVPVNAGVLCADDCWSSLCQWMLGFSVLMIVGVPVPVNVGVLCANDCHQGMVGGVSALMIVGVLCADDCQGSLCRWLSGFPVKWMLGFSMLMIVGVPCCDKFWGSLCWWLSGSLCSGVC